MNLIVASNKLHMARVKVGDKVTEKVTLGNCFQQEFMTGTVIYVHPKRRFYRVRFDMPGGSFTESYLFFKCKGDW